MNGFNAAGATDEVRWVFVPALRYIAHLHIKDALSFQMVEDQAYAKPPDGLRRNARAIRAIG